MTAPPIRTLAALLLGGLVFAGTAKAAGTCPEHVRCGSVTVPLDRADPSAGTIDVAYALVPRTDTSRPALGTIAPNPGGPGQSTIASAGLYLDALAPLRTRRDLLLIDPRGTGRSGALGCPSLASHDPLSLDYASLGTICGADLGERAGLYGSAAVADDIDAVRASLGVDKLDLWGDSYGTFLMPVYAARHPEHVRSIVLDGAYPVAFDPWGRDILKGVRRTITLVCRRTRRCSGPHVLTQLERLAARLRRHPVRFSVNSPIGPVQLTLGEHELANVTYAGGDPQVYGLLPAAVDAALDRDLAPLERLVAASRTKTVGYLSFDPSVVSFAGQVATSCHDYPHAFSLADPPATRHADYDRALAALDPAQFAPFSPGAWLSTDIEAGPKCLDSPADPTAGSPLQGHALPDVPVLVQSGELDTNTPIEAGHEAAAQFAHPLYAVVANAGHTPDVQPCGVAQAIEFVERLTTDTKRCVHAGRPPAVAARPPLRAAELAADPVRRAVAVALATLADARTADTLGTLDALRGGTYATSEHHVRFRGARVVSDVTASGLQTIGRHATRTHLRLRGRGVAPAELTLVSAAGKRTRITGSVGGRHVALTVSAT
jgi:pimeloyl-ACP methyl ester carboxylesterase